MRDPKREGKGQGELEEDVALELAIRAIRDGVLPLEALIQEAQRGNRVALRAIEILGRLQ